jgi:hypothetical protein
MRYGSLMAINNERIEKGLPILMMVVKEFLGIGAKGGSEPVEGARTGHSFCGAFHCSVLDPLPPICYLVSIHKREWLPIFTRPGKRLDAGSSPA